MTKVTLKELFKDFLGDYFTFDSKVFRSIGPLLFRPGQLTIAFNAGKRIRYIHPLRMYLLVSLVFFFLLSMSPFVQTELPKDAGHAPGTNDSRITMSGPGGKTIVYDNAEAFRKDVDRHGMEAYLDSLQANSAFEQFAIRQWYRNAGKSRRELTDQITKGVSFSMFLLMPMLALLLMLFYRRLHLYFVEHLVFSFHLHTTWFLLASVFRICMLLGLSIPMWIAVPVYGFYTLVPLKRVYGKTWMGTVLRFLGLMLLYAVLVLMFVITGMVLSLVLN